MSRRSAVYRRRLSRLFEIDELMPSAIVDHDDATGFFASSSSICARAICSAALSLNPPTNPLCLRRG
jgi:hypothetical protein